MTVVASSLMIYGAIGVGLLSLAFIIYELKNAPYYDSFDPEQRLNQIERQRPRYRTWD
ncbi:hypothetical protein [Methylobacterium sp. B4]|uniref:hypothetical protein n=1 Tax=Methylobacterium sp. B4 TaxID=1938755 RepID=UPI000D9A6D7C|nr:hypothetical protein [Methylobacterium sp. B4]PXW64183.1 hypothetical protein BY998_104236 [Methylobacterium sp. B4]